MELERLLALYRLLTDFLSDEEWDRASPAWAAMVETRRQVAWEIRRKMQDWPED